MLILQGPTALTLDLVNVVRRMKLLGFNAVRLPFSFTGADSALQYACQDDGLTHQQRKLLGVSPEGNHSTGFTYHGECSG